MNKLMEIGCFATFLHQTSNIKRLCHHNAKAGQCMKNARKQRLHNECELPPLHNVHFPLASHLSVG